MLAHENSRFLLKSGIFFIFQDSTRFDDIIAEHQIVHAVLSVSGFSMWYSIKRASRSCGIFGDAVVRSHALDNFFSPISRNLQISFYTDSKYW